MEIIELALCIVITILLLNINRIVFLNKLLLLKKLNTILKKLNTLFQSYDFLRENANRKIASLTVFSSDTVLGYAHGIGTNGFSVL